MRYFLAALLLTACTNYVPTPLVAQERQDAYAGYVDGINQKLKDVWNPKQAFHDYPNRQLPAGKITTVIIAVIDEEGDVVSADAQVSTGHDFVDREASRAIAMSAPFAKPPQGLLRRSGRGLVASIPLQFSVTVPGQPGSFVAAGSLSDGPANTSITPTELYLEL